MQRRSFLKAFAAAAPAAGLQDFLVSHARAQASALPASGALLVVGDGEDRSGHPFRMPTSSLSVKVATSETSGGALHCGAYASAAGWTGSASAPVSGRVVLCDGGRGGTSARRATAAPACGGICSGSAARAAHFFIGWGGARPSADCLLSRGKDGAILPRYPGSQGTSLGCGVHAALRHGADWTFSVLEVVGTSGLLAQRSPPPQSRSERGRICVR